MAPKDVISARSLFVIGGSVASGIAVAVAVVLLLGGGSGDHGNGALNQFTFATVTPTNAPTPTPVGQTPVLTPTPVGQTPAPTPPASPPPISAPFTTTASGLQIATVQDGAGATPHAHDSVTVNYTGWLQAGGLFDSSLSPGRSPLQFALGEGRVIKAFDEAVPQMKVGGVYRIIAPPDLAYGATGSPPYIPGNATLIFDISVLDTQAPTPAP